MIDPSGERTIVTFRDPELWKVQLPGTDDAAGGLRTPSSPRAAAPDSAPISAPRRAGAAFPSSWTSTARCRCGRACSTRPRIWCSRASRCRRPPTSPTTAQALKKIAKLTPSFLAGTRGPQGTIWLDEHGHLQETPAFPVHTVDTLGAGDVFHGAFALAITEGQDIPSALRFASAAAALKCTRFGGAFAAPQRAEVEALLSQGQPADPARTGQ